MQKQTNGIKTGRFPPSYAWFTSNNFSPSGSVFTHNDAFQALGNGVHCTRYKQDKNKEDKE